MLCQRAWQQLFAGMADEKIAAIGGKGRSNSVVFSPYSKEKAEGLRQARPELGDWMQLERN